MTKEEKSSDVSDERRQREEKNLIEKVKSGSQGKAVDGQMKQPALDRRWIIKMKDEKNSQTKAPKPMPQVWSSREQESRCEEYIKGLKDSFSKTRLSSVHGDACSTARHARVFMDLVQQCSNDCPEGYAKSKGYSARIIQNVSVLHELGEKRCFQPVAETMPEMMKAAPRAEKKGTTPMKNRMSIPTSKAGDRPGSKYSR